MASNQPFQGKVFGITGNMDRDAVFGQIKKAGGQVSNTMHKRVSFLVCTEESVKRNTQRVRKAAKLNVPLVSLAFVSDAVATGKLPDATKYTVSKPVKALAAAAAAKPQTANAPTADGSGEDDGSEESSAEEGSEKNRSGGSKGRPDESAVEHTKSSGKRNHAGKESGKNSKKAKVDGGDGRQHR